MSQCDKLSIKKNRMNFQCQCCPMLSKPNKTPQNRHALFPRSNDTQPKSRFSHLLPQCEMCTDARFKLAPKKKRIAFRNRGCPIVSLVPQDTPEMSYAPSVPQTATRNKQQGPETYFSPDTAQRHGHATSPQGDISAQSALMCARIISAHADMRRNYCLFFQFRISFSSPYEYPLSQTKKKIPQETHPLLLLSYPVSFLPSSPPLPGPKGLPLPDGE